MSGVVVWHAADQRDWLPKLKQRLDKTESSYRIIADIADVGMQEELETERMLRDASSVVVVLSPRFLARELDVLERIFPFTGLSASQVVPIVRDGTRVPEWLQEAAPIDFSSTAEVDKSFNRLFQRIERPRKEPPRVSTLQLTPSVEAAVGRVGSTPVTSRAMVREIAGLHAEYAAGLARNISLRIDAADDRRRSAMEWLQGVRILADEKRVTELHGRVVIIALALIDVSLGRELAASGFLQALGGEIREPLSEVLSPLGLRRWQTSLPRTEVVSPIQDIPTVHDRLNRQPIAEALAARIKTIRAQGEAGPFRVLVRGPWGSGKTTLLRLLEQLVTRDNWVVVWFNAWEHQRVGPPWWALTNELFRQGMRSIRRTSRRRSWRLRMQEYSWRFSAGRAPEILALAAFAWLVVVLLPAGTASLPPLFDRLAALTASLATVYGVLLASSRWLLLGSSSGAKAYLAITPDPLKPIAEHFNNLVEWIQRPVLVFVDDLDRCQETYVVNLLEGLQTVFKDARVTYVIAADSRWIRRSYGKAYEDFEDVVKEAGRPLGHLFLAKTFQMTVSVPRIERSIQSAYWLHLLGIRPTGGQTDPEQQLRAARSAARDTVRALRSEQEMLEALKDRNSDSIEDVAFRSEVVVRLSEADIEAAREHALQPYSSMLEPNPRAMKRTLNHYGMLRAVAVVAKLDIDPDSLVRWAILGLRWPDLTDYLSARPERVALFGKQRVPEDVPEWLRPLLGNADAVRVVSGLDESVVRACASLEV